MFATPLLGAGRGVASGLNFGVQVTLKSQTAHFSQQGPGIRGYTVLISQSTVGP